MKKLKYVSMMALFLSGAAIAQQGVIFNKSTIYEQSVHYQIIYKKDDQYVILEDKTIAIPASRYTVINFPSSADPDHTMLSVLSATQKNGAKGVYPYCESGLGGTNAAIMLQEQNDSKLITCDKLDYSNNITDNQ